MNPFVFEAIMNRAEHISKKQTARVLGDCPERLCGQAMNTEAAGIQSDSCFVG